MTAADMSLTSSCFRPGECRGGADSRCREVHLAEADRSAEMPPGSAGLATVHHGSYTCSMPVLRWKAQGLASRPGHVRMLAYE
jgi:hypothetical protein